jgi:hypothetical protein
MPGAALARRKSPLSTATTAKTKARSLSLKKYLGFEAARCT